MADSVVQIYNMALGWLGGHQLPSVEAAWEDDEAGRLCQTYYPQILREALEAHDWSFAASSQDLGRKPGYGREDYSIRYGLPSDYLRAIRLEGGNHYDQPHFIIEGEHLLTDAAPARLIYIALVDDPKKLPPAFVTAVSYGLASFLATGANNDQQAQNNCQQKYLTMLEEAWARDLGSQKPKRKPSAWASARHGGWSGRQDWQ